MRILLSFVIGVAALASMGRTADVVPVRIERDALQVSCDSIGLRAVVTLANDLDDGAECILATYCLSAAGDTLATKHSYTHVPARGTWTFDMSIPLDNPATVSELDMDLRGDGFVNLTIDHYVRKLDRN